MRPTAGAASGMLPGGRPARGTEHAQATWTSRMPTTLFKPFALGGDAPASGREAPAATAWTLGDHSGSRAGHWDCNVTLPQLCLASSLQTAFTTQRVYTSASYTLLLSRNSSSAAVTAPSPCCCMQQLSIHKQPLFYRTPYHPAAILQRCRRLRVTRPCTNDSSAAPVVFVFGL